MTDNDWTQAEQLLTVWLRRARDSQHSHHEAGKFCRQLHYWFSVPVIILTTLIGTTFFATIERQVTDTVKIWLGALSMLAAILTAIQTHFQFSERSEIHKSIGAQYGIVRRDIEKILALPPGKRGDPKEVLERIEKQLNDLADKGPVVSRRIWEYTRRLLTQKDKVVT